MRSILVMVFSLLFLSATGLCADLNDDLRKAASKGNVARVKDLLEKGASINAPDKNGKTAIQLAWDKERDAVVEILVTAGASLDRAAPSLIAFAECVQPSRILTLGAAPVPSISADRQREYKAVLDTQYTAKFEWTVAPDNKTRPGVGIGVAGVGAIGLGNFELGWNSLTAGPNKEIVILLNPAQLTCRGVMGTKDHLEVFIGTDRVWDFRGPMKKSSSQTPLGVNSPGIDISNYVQPDGSFRITFRTLESKVTGSSMMDPILIRGFWVGTR